MDYATCPARMSEGRCTKQRSGYHIEPLEEGGFLATSPDVPGLVAEGRSITEAAEIAQGLARKIAESCIEHGDPLPRALADLPESGAAGFPTVP